MRIKITGCEAPYELRALSVMLAALADGRERDMGSSGRYAAGITEDYAGYTMRADPLPGSEALQLTPGDAPSQFDPEAPLTAADSPYQVLSPSERQMEPGDTATVEVVPGVFVAPAEPAKRTRRTKAQIAADKLAAAPAAPAGEQLQLAVPEVPTAPLAYTASPASVTPASDTAVSTPAPTAPAAPTVPVAPSAAPDGVPKTFAELMRKISPALATKKQNAAGQVLTGDALNAVCAQAGVAGGIGPINMQGLLQNQQLVPAVYELLRSWL